MLFKYAQLEEFLSSVKALGPLELFGSFNGGKAFLLRHDVDFDLKLAYDIAKIEFQAGVVSTYFVLTSCPFYNVLSATSRDLLRAIHQLGHEIGLHFDPTLYDEEGLDYAVEKEVDVLSFAVGCPVGSISLHNPTVHGKYPLFEGYVNAYDPSLFSNANYISDSRYSFRGKNPFEFIKNIDSGVVQILLHPMHYSENGDAYDTVVTNSCKRMICAVHDNFLPNSVYHDQVGDDLLALIIERELS